MTFKLRTCKVTAILLMLILTLSTMLISCSSERLAQKSTDSKITAKDPYEINMWIFPMSDDTEKENEMYSNMVKGFEQNNPGKTVNIQILPWSNRETKMMTAMAANKGPDVTYMNPDIMRLFVYHEVLMPLDQYISDDIKNDFYPSLLEESKVEGKTYGIPILLDILSHVYNLTMLKEIGMDENSLPKTYDEYEEMCKKLKEKGLYGTYYEYAQSPIGSGLYAQLYSEGNISVTPEGEIVIDNESGRKVFERIIRWYELGYTPKDSATTTGNQGWSSFLAGSVASCHPGGSNVYKQKEIQQVDFEWAVGPVLAGAEGAYETSTVGSLSITKDCKDIEATYKWIEWFTNKENIAEFCKHSGFFAPRQSVGNLFEDIKGLDVIYSQLDSGKGEVKHACARQMDPLITQNVQAMALGSKTIDQGLADIREGIDKIIKQLEQIRTN